MIPREISTSSTLSWFCSHIASVKTCKLVLLACVLWLLHEFCCCWRVSLLKGFLFSIYWASSFVRIFIRSRDPLKFLEFSTWILRCGTVYKIICLATYLFLNKSYNVFIRLLTINFFSYTLWTYIKTIIYWLLQSSRY